MSNEAKAAETGAYPRTSRRVAKPAPVVLIENTKPAVEDCRWCDALVGEVHSRACPCGERYWQVQDLGAKGVPFSSLPSSNQESQ